MTEDSARSTRDALIDAGLTLFGERGFAASSTRALAQRAQANVAAIAYHFGSKAGLRDACGREAARRMAEDVVGDAVAGLDAALSRGMDAAQARERLLTLIDALAPAILRHADLDATVRFLLREQTEMSPAFAALHDAFLAPMHERLCKLWAAATGADPASPQTRLTTLTFVAQVVYFRIARNVALTRLGWREIGPAEAKEIVATIKRNLVAALDAASAPARRAEG